MGPEATERIASGEAGCRPAEGLLSAMPRFGYARLPKKDSSLPSEAPAGDLPAPAPPEEEANHREGQGMTDEEAQAHTAEPTESCLGAVGEFSAPQEPTPYRADDGTDRQAAQSETYIL